MRARAFAFDRRSAPSRPSGARATKNKVSNRRLAWNFGTQRASGTKRFQIAAQAHATRAVRSNSDVGEQMRAAVRPTASGDGSGDKPTGIAVSSSASRIAATRAAAIATPARQAARPPRSMRPPGKTQAPPAKAMSGCALDHQEFRGAAAAVRGRGSGSRRGWRRRSSDAALGARRSKEKGRRLMGRRPSRTHGGRPTCPGRRPRPSTGSSALSSAVRPVPRQRSRRRAAACWSPSAFSFGIGRIGRLLVQRVRFDILCFGLVERVSIPAAACGQARARRSRQGEKQASSSTYPHESESLVQQTHSNERGGPCKLVPQRPKSLSGGPGQPGYVGRLSRGIHTSDPGGSTPAPPPPAANRGEIRRLLTGAK